MFWLTGADPVAQKLLGLCGSKERSRNSSLVWKQCHLYPQRWPRRGDFIYLFVYLLGSIYISMLPWISIFIVFYLIFWFFSILSSLPLLIFLSITISSSVSSFLCVWPNLRLCNPLYVCHSPEFILLSRCIVACTQRSLFLCWADEKTSPASP